MGDWPDNRPPQAMRPTQPLRTMSRFLMRLSPATRCSFWQPMLKPTTLSTDDLVMRSQTTGSDPLRRTVHKRRLLTGDTLCWQWKLANFISNKVVRLYIIASDNLKKLVLIIDLKPKDHFTTRRRELQLKHLPGRMCFAKN